MYYSPRVPGSSPCFAGPYPLNMYYYPGRSGSSPSFAGSYPSSIYYSPGDSGSYPSSMYYSPRLSGSYPLNMYYSPRNAGNSPRSSGSTQWRNRRADVVLLLAIRTCKSVPEISQRFAYRAVLSCDAKRCISRSKESL
jgi:hypothetical protein